MNQRHRRSLTYREAEVAMDAAHTRRIRTQRAGMATRGTGKTSHQMD